MSSMHLSQPAGSSLQEYTDSSPCLRPVTVLVIAAQALVSRAISQLLSSQREVKQVATARNYIEARECITRLQPDIIWLDRYGGRFQGFEEIQQLKRLAPASRIMVLTDLENEQEAFKVFMAGAQGYLSNQELELNDIMTIIRKLCRDELVISEGRLAGLIQSLRDLVLPLWATENMSGASVVLRDTEQHDLEHLTAREREVLMWISQGRRDGDVAKGLRITPQTVQKHVQNILSKLGVQNRTQAAYLFHRQAASW